MKKPTITIIGSGNVAHTLAFALFEKGVVIKNIAARNLNETNKLAKKTNAIASGIEQADLTSDAIILCVSDDAITQIAKLLKKYEGVMIHTSGSVSVEVLPQKNAAVLYPFISMQKTRKIDLAHADIFIEARNEKSKKVVATIAKMLSKRIKSITSEQRLSLHLAAVFAQNFVNHQMHIAQLLLEKNGMKFQLLERLIANYFSQLETETPDKLQTGPAVRSDNNVIKRHLDILQHEPELKSIYKLLTKNIQKMHKHD